MSMAAIGASAVTLVGGKLLGGGGGGGGGAAGMADPFAPYRGQYADLLASLYGTMTPGTSGGGQPATTQPAGGGIEDYIRAKEKAFALGDDSFPSSYEAWGGGGRGRNIVRSAIDSMTGRGGGAPSGTPGPQSILDWFKSNPAYQFAYDEAMRGTERSMAARGYNMSGNLLTALQERGSGLASQQYNAEVNRLMALSGATTGQPGVAGQIAYNQGVDQYQRGQQMAGTIGYGVGAALNAPAGTWNQFKDWAGGTDYYTNPGEFDWGD